MVYNSILIYEAGIEGDNTCCAGEINTDRFNPCDVFLQLYFRMFMREG
jgi:hypothetical protein